MNTSFCLLIVLTCVLSVVCQLDDYSYENRGKFSFTNEGNFFTIEGKLFTIEGKFFTIEGKLFLVDGKRFIVEGKLFSVVGELFIITGKHFTVKGKLFTVKGKIFTVKGKLFPSRENCLPSRENFLPSRENCLPSREKKSLLIITFPGTCNDGDCGIPACRCACDPLVSGRARPSPSNPANLCEGRGNVVTAAASTCVNNHNNSGCLDCYDYTKFPGLNTAALQAEWQQTFQSPGNPNNGVNPITHCWISANYLPGVPVGHPQYHNFMKFCFTGHGTLQQCGGCFPNGK